MTITTTPTISGYIINSYLGLVNANQVVGANMIADFLASFSDVFGGTSGAYRERLDVLYNDIKIQLEQKAQTIGANAIVGVHIDFDEISGKGKSMFMITAYGTAVNISQSKEREKHLDRYEIYQKLFNLSKFKEAGVITEEQYIAERDNILYNHENDIVKGITNLKKENEQKGAVIQAQRLAEQRLKNQPESSESKKQTGSKVQIDADLFKDKEVEINEAIEAFLQRIPTVIPIVQNILSSTIDLNPERLNHLAYDDIMMSSYERFNLDQSNNAAFNVALLIKMGKIAEACKFYIDLIGVDDIEDAKSYIMSVYDTLIFKSPKEFEDISKKIIPFKCVGQNEEAIQLLAEHVMCDHETAMQIVNLI